MGLRYREKRSINKEGNQRAIKARREKDSLVLESWHNNSAHAPLDHDDGGPSPDTYLHLINKNERW